MGRNLRAGVEVCPGEDGKTLSHHRKSAMTKDTRRNICFAPAAVVMMVVAADAVINDGLWWLLLIIPALGGFFWLVNRDAERSL